MNTFPTRPSARRLAVVFEYAPGANAYLTDALLSSSGIDRDTCFLGTLGPELATDLARFDPHFMLLLDRYGAALKLFSGEKRSVDNWRGSLLLTHYTGKPVKCMATYHPQRIQMEYGLSGVARFDFERVARELATDELVVPQDVITINGRKEHLLHMLDGIRSFKLPVAVDIEGYPNGISCIGFADSSNHAFVVPFTKHDNTSYWSEADELELWQAVKDVLEDVNVPKICHNALYELFCLAWAYGIVIRGLEHDTMLMHYELYCEMEKSLGFCTSIYTKQPYYKSERKSTDDRELLLYNGKDCCRTYECWQAMTPKLAPKQREHYEFNMSMLVPLAYMSLRGMRYDKAAAERRLAEVQQKIYETQDEINREASEHRPCAGANGPQPQVAVALSSKVGCETQAVCDNKSGRETHQSRTETAEAAGSREMLKQFFDAIGSGASGSTMRSTSSELPTKKLVDLFTVAFCRARRTEVREVTETKYHPMRWNGKKWVKDNKRVIEQEAKEQGLTVHAIECKEAPTDTSLIWFKPTTKLVTRNIPVEITTFEDVQRFAKDSCFDGCKQAIKVCRTIADGRVTASLCGQLATLLDIHVKINSTGEGGDAQWFLYEHCQLPKQFQKDGLKLTTKLASDDEAVIKAYLASGKDDATRDKRALTFLRMRKLVTESKTLAADCDPDGRIRCSYNLVGTDTHRLTCYESNTGSGYNLQTVTKKHRNLFVADDGHWICQRDLSGADGWTVAAYSAMLGDTTMLEDYRAKLKPAKVAVLMLEHGIAVNTWDRAKLKELCAPIDEDMWQYFGMKRVQHGSSYLMGKNTMSSQILTDSFKKDGVPVYISPTDCERIQQTCFFVRYPGIKRTHEWMARELKSKGVLTASNGFTRKFYGRKDDNATVRAALGHLPQVFTTYATNLATMRIWNDPDNRRVDGSLKIEPLHTVHDALITQWRKEDTEWAKVKIQDYFNNELLIAGTTLVIPASGSYGPDWLNQPFAL